MLGLTAAFLQTQPTTSLKPNAQLKPFVDYNNASQNIAKVRDLKRKNVRTRTNNNSISSYNSYFLICTVS